VLTSPADPDELVDWLSQYAPMIAVLSVGRSIDLYKDVGAPADIAERYAFKSLHRLASGGAHTDGDRIGGDSAHAHPFTAGEDFCLVHNGSLSNPHLRAQTGAARHRFETDNDTEGACRFLEWRLREGETSSTAVQRAFSDLDGFFTFLMGTQDKLRWCATPSPASRRSSPRPTITSPLPRNSGRWRICRTFKHATVVRAQAGGDVFMANLRPVPNLREFDLEPRELRELNLFLHGALTLARGCRSSSEKSRRRAPSRWA
jgi:hypothetical protein